MANDDRTDGGPKFYPPETVLKFDQVLEWLQISETTADRIGLRDKLPSVAFGYRSRRYVVRQILDWMDQEAGVQDPRRPR